MPLRHGNISQNAGKTMRTADLDKCVRNGTLLRRRNLPTCRAVIATTYCGTREKTASIMTPQTQVAVYAKEASMRNP
jgi:hypothetical protein